MFVRSIVESKQIRQIVTIKPEESITSAAQLLARHRIGALVVSLDGVTVEGIISERDIVRALGTEGVACMTRTVGELMTSDVHGSRLDERASSVVERMTHGRFRHMPVLEDGRLVGLISIGDVVKAHIDEIKHENTALTEMITNSW